MQATMHRDILESLFNFQQNMKSRMLRKKRVAADEITQPLSSMRYTHTVFTFLEHFHYLKKYFSISLDLPLHIAK